MVLLYEVALYLVLILGLPFFLFRRKYASTFSERMGHYRTASRGHDVWIHAVSVGETLAAKPVVDEIVRMRPETTIVFTTTTATGQAQAKRRFPAATVTYFPLAFSVAAKRFLNHHRPRKTERFDVVAGMLNGVPFVRRSGECAGHAGALTAAAWPPHSTALLLDTIGELARVYRHATVAFIGGSLVPTGGHNPIEPAAVGVPVCFGPHMSNF